jgi:hypothetical protein
MPQSLDPLLADAMESLLLPCGRVIGQAIADEVEGLAAKGMLRASPLKLAASLRDRASAGTFTPRAGLEVAVKRAAAEKKRMEESRKAQAKADRLAKECDPSGLVRKEAARITAMEELKKRGFVA